MPGSISPYRGSSCEGCLSGCNVSTKKSEDGLKRRLSKGERPTTSSLTCLPVFDLARLLLMHMHHDHNASPKLHRKSTSRKAACVNISCKFLASLQSCLWFCPDGNSSILVPIPRSLLPGCKRSIRLCQGEFPPGSSRDVSCSVSVATVALLSRRQAFALCSVKDTSVLIVQQTRKEGKHQSEVT